jgi:catechol 2,3-dioxygenase-like lactoylglutathione lyase family enzyme
MAARAMPQTVSERVAQPQNERLSRLFRDPQVNFYVRDVERSVRFYADFFGFTESFRTPESGPPIHVELRLGGLILGLASIDSALGMHGLTTGMGAPKAEVCLWTDDVDREYERLVAHGVQSLSSPHDFLGRLRAAWLADPDGNPVEIVAEH